MEAVPAEPKPVLKGIETGVEAAQERERDEPAEPKPVLKGIETNSHPRLPQARSGTTRRTQARLKGALKP